MRAYLRKLVSQNSVRSRSWTPSRPLSGRAPAVGSQFSPVGLRVQPSSRLMDPFSSEELNRFTQICGQATEHSDYPLSNEIAHNAVVYSGDRLRHLIASGNQSRDDIMAEIHRCLATGPGVLVIRKFVIDLDLIQRTNGVLNKIIESERDGAKGDHFATAGNNDRIWNSFQKHAVADPRSFVEYYSNVLLDMVSEAWLGPGYQLTAQVNVVRPGGKAQQPHRDYHLGFQSERTASRFPIISQIASAMLTLQGAVAHTPMPLASGPTQLLPFSQQFDHGYIAYRQPEFVDFFHKHMVQTALDTGDALFFNPALFHAAGDNNTKDLHRMGNLLQVSACWSKPMETVDRNAIIRATWPDVKDYIANTQGGLDSPSSQALLKAICDGYSFPTNLDKDPPPADSHCPETQLDRVTRGVAEKWSGDTLNQALDELAAKRAA
ncbi:phytanoyl-CoA dioxygenase [Cryptococcus gattii E566]|uniref:Phytanoyl-CoA dioxygenase n=2 Tax=Cryptococcus gattii TaxID=37769 RepID=E6RBK7_CRYGW|nr:uncharacterized protein CGB_I4530C [Cryptococcus gattii WM276]ADV24496.1 conserved hypothetical protein [Cryptococcus gattii WM276]KIR76197.1 phytanoyl-CoA dioxygenase [Cryptococcus gattii EJB2]KIY30937.1 phytanoyl-CoA dioxygenase [Cryptococcus gattii E566]KJE01952.1 phytanoyl-CoA dioxygenase [Cryptococcus gattii NT-10]